MYFAKFILLNTYILFTVKYGIDAIYLVTEVTLNLIYLKFHTPLVYLLNSNGLYDSILKCDHHDREIYM
jgi:hypothetical protein